MNFDSAIFERISLWNQPLEAGCVGIRMLEIIKEYALAKKKILIFYNRRWSASALICQDCGFFQRCPHCDIALSYHAFPKPSLLCHQCHYRENIFANCPNCSWNHLKTVGVGIESISRAISKNLSDISVGIIDSDHTKKTAEIFEIVKKNTVIISTNMGIFLKNSNIGAILFPLFELNNSIPEYDFEESFYAHLSYCKKQNLPLYIQTFALKNPFLEEFLYGNYKSYLDFLKKERKAFSYPPFVDFVTIRVHHREKSEVERMILWLVERIEMHKTEGVFMAFDTEIWEKDRGEWSRKIILKWRGVVDILEKISSAIVQNRHIYLQWH